MIKNSIHIHITRLSPFSRLLKLSSRSGDVEITSTEETDEVSGILGKMLALLSEFFQSLLLCRNKEGRSEKYGSEWGRGWERERREKKREKDRMQAKNEEKKKEIHTSNC